VAGHHEKRHHRQPSTSYPLIKPYENLKGYSASPGELNCLPWSDHSYGERLKQWNNMVPTRAADLLASPIGGTLAYARRYQRCH